jgi:hypothetical protein
MGKATHRQPAKHLDAPEVTGIDATPERFAKDDSDVVTALIDRAGERPGKARRFRSSHLDRMHKSGTLNYYQWYAGDWYRNTHNRCQFPLSVVASYGERSGAGEYPGTFGYGLPRQEAQLRARDALRMARAQFPRDMIGFMDRLLIHDSMPRYGGRAAMRNVAQIRRALDTLAGYLQLGAAGKRKFEDIEPIVIGVDVASGPVSASVSVFALAADGAAEVYRASMDPAFLDDRGLMLPAEEIAGIIRGRMEEGET